jgi:hypothetical protein
MDESLIGIEEGINLDESFIWWRHGWKCHNFAPRLVEDILGRRS